MKRPTGSVPRRCEQHEDVVFAQTFEIVAIFPLPPSLTLELLRRQVAQKDEEIEALLRQLSHRLN